MKIDKCIRLLRPIEKKLMPIESKLYGMPRIRSTFQAIYNHIIPDRKLLIDVYDQKMYVSLRARHYIQGIFERGTTEVFRRVVKNGMTVVDVGANIGYYTIIAACLVGQEGTVFSFEPHPGNYEKLRENVEVNGYTNCYLVNKTISDKREMTKFYLHSDSGRSSLLHTEDERNWLEVETIALDEFFEAEKVIPDIIKMDIEGAEPLALNGMKIFIEECEGLILFIEYAYNQEYIFRFLDERGFELYFIRVNGELTPLEKGGRKNSNLESNIFAVKGRMRESMLEYMKTWR